MSDAVVDISKLSIDEELSSLDAILWANQRIWLIERSEKGIWGIAIVKDLPESQWPEPIEGEPLSKSDTWVTIAYRRHENLAKAIRDVREDVIARNAKQVADDEEADLAAEKQFTKPINPDPITGIAKALKD
jgi:hypothetical protein